MHPILQQEQTAKEVIMSDWTLPTDSEEREMREAVQADKAYRAAIAADRRRKMRVGLQADVTGASQTNFFSGLSEDISDGGVFVATMSPPPVGESVHLKVTVNGDSSRTVVVRGVVRWHRTDEAGTPSGCGIQFVEVDGTLSQAIAGLVQAAGQEPLFWDV